MSRRNYVVACLARNGVGPELIAEATRAVEAVSRLHGFSVDDHHVPVGTEAFMRFGHPYPLSSRRNVLEADSVLVDPGTDDTVDAIEAELDLRASIGRVRYEGEHELSVLAPLADDAWGWTIGRAFELARASRGRVTFVGVDERWSSAATVAEAEHDGIAIERLTAGETMQRLVEAAYRFDVLVVAPELAQVAADVAACTARQRVAAWGRLAASGPSVFGAVARHEPEAAGAGVVDPRPMLLAAALLLGEGLGERAAGATLSDAVAKARPHPAAASTRGLADRVLARLANGLRVEFLREAV
jgi:isocitrate/isopropylmalate dehydrogenase